MDDKGATNVPEADVTIPDVVSEESPPRSGGKDPQLKSETEDSEKDLSHGGEGSALAASEEVVPAKNGAAIESSEQSDSAQFDEQNTEDKVNQANTGQIAYEVDSILLSGGELAPSAENEADVVNPDLVQNLSGESNRDPEVAAVGDDEGTKEEMLVLDAAASSETLPSDPVPDMEQSEDKEIHASETKEHANPEEDPDNSIQEPEVATSETKVQADLVQPVIEDEGEKEAPRQSDAAADLEEKGETGDNLQDKSNDIAEHNVSDSDGSQGNSVPSLPDDTSSESIVVVSPPVSEENVSLMDTAQQDGGHGHVLPVGGVSEFVESEMIAASQENQDDGVGVTHRDNDVEEETVPDKPTSKDGHEEEQINRDQAFESFASPHVDSQCVSGLDKVLDPVVVTSVDSGGLDDEHETATPLSSDINIEDKGDDDVSQTLLDDAAEAGNDFGAASDVEISDKNKEQTSEDVINTSTDEVPETLTQEIAVEEPFDNTNGSSTMAPQEDSQRNTNEDVVHAVPDNVQVQVEVKAEIPDLIPAAVPSDIGDVSTVDDVKEQEFGNASDATTGVQEVVTGADNVIVSDQDIDPPVDIKESEDAATDTSTAVADSTAAAETMTLQQEDNVENVPELATPNPDITTNIDLSHDLSMDTPLLLDTNSSENAPFLDKKEDVSATPDVISSTAGYEEQASGECQDEKAPLVKKAKDETSYGTSHHEDDNVGGAKAKQQPSSIYLRLQNFVHAYCNIL